MKSKIALLILGTSLICATQGSLGMKKEKRQEKILKTCDDQLIKPTVELTEYFIKFDSDSIASLHPLEKNKELSNIWKKANKDSTMMNHTDFHALVGYMRYFFKKSFGKELPVKDCWLKNFSRMVVQELQNQRKDMEKLFNHEEEL